MKEYSDYKGFDILGYHVNSMNEQVLDVICNIVKYDEFNRIDIEVLSVIAQQLLTIRVAKLRGDSVFFFN